MRLLALVAATAVAVSGVGVAAADPESPHGPRWSGHFDHVYDDYAPAWTTLRDGDPHQAGLDPAPLESVLDQVRAYSEADPTRRPLLAGAVTTLVHNGVVVQEEALGWAVRYADGEGAELPPEQRVPMTEDTIFDLASISKLFTSIVVMREVEAGRIDLDEPVAKYLPEFGVNGKASITVEQLLTHTSGLEPFILLWKLYPDPTSRIKAVMDVAPIHTPGTRYVYSDLNLITLGVLVERVGGAPLDELVRTGITEPLGMVDSGYNPPASKLHRIAATEYQANPPRGMVRGSVHDENAWSLGGVAGHAGMFATARDLAKLAQAILNGGGYGGRRVLEPESVTLMMRDFNTEFPDNSHGLGFELNQRWYMGGLSAPRTAGHTGYTGPALVIDPASRSISILMANRVHPSRSWGSVNPVRRVLTDGLARALGVRPQHGPTSWTPSATGATLTTKALPEAGRLAFDAFVDLDVGDRVELRSSADGVTWQPVRLTVDGRDAAVLTGAGHRTWWQVTADVPAGQVRWVFTRGTGYGGRGVHLDGIRVHGERGVLLDAERDPHALVADGWRSVRR